MLRRKIESKIRKKREELNVVQDQITELRSTVREIEAYISGQEEILKMVPATTANGSDESVAIRRGSLADKAREYLRKENRPIKLMEILSGLGMEKARRQTLSGTLSSYVRKGQIFTRPFPGTFGLVEFENEINEKAEDDVIG